jgi:translation initiation factor 5
MVEVAADELEKKAAIEAAAAEESEEEEDERIAKVRGYVTKHDAKETAEYLVSDKLGCESKELGVHFLVEALFDEDEPLVPQIKAKKAYMIAACGQDAKLQTALVCAVELFITESATEQFKQYVAILKELYDEDVLDEEIILKWGADPKSAAKFGVELETSQAVRKQVKPFLEWLAQDDSDSD